MAVPLPEVLLLTRISNSELFKKPQQTSKFSPLSRHCAFAGLARVVPSVSRPLDDSTVKKSGSVHMLVWSNYHMTRRYAPSFRPC